MRKFILSFLQLMGLCTETLIGCYIDGLLYGDTILPVGVNQISSHIPASFSLFQNYPNPFNPNSKIKFQIPELSKVTLTIYDLLGREVEMLIEQRFSPGTYEVQFDGTNYPGGVYLYKLETEDFLESRKMVLIK